METETTIKVDRSEELEWFNLRLSAIAKQNEAEALRARAESILQVAGQWGERANAKLAEIKAKMEIPEGYEGEVRDEHLVFVKGNANQPI